MEESRRVLHIKSGGEDVLIGWENIRQLIMKPQVYPVPGAPSRVAGIMEFEGELVGVYGRSLETSACVVMLRGEDGGNYGLLADEIDGGAYGDS